MKSDIIRIFMKFDIIRIFMKSDIIRIFMKSDIIRIFMKFDIIRIFMKCDIIIIFINCYIIVILWNLIFQYFSKIYRDCSRFIKIGQEKGYFAWRPVHIFDHISLISSQNEKCLRQNCTESPKPHFRFKKTFIENRAVYEILCKNTAEPGRPQMKTWRMRITCWLPRLQTHTHNM